MKKQRSLRGKVWTQGRRESNKTVLQNLVLAHRCGRHDPKVWLKPGWKDLADPFLLRDMDKAVKRVQAALENQERIMVYGDFDADGITSTVALVDGLKSLGASVSYRIPDRVNDSHGLKRELIEEIASTGSKLIITVDCGVNDREEVDFARRLGLEVIILDHHQIDPDRWAQNAVAVVNPAYPECPYPTPHLAGVGVTFKFLQALRPDPLWLERYAALVAIGTVADCVSLSQESRTLVQLGLQALNKNLWPGVTALIEPSGDIEAETISFQLAPCINAASRLGQVQHAVQLFIGDPLRQADRVAYLKQLNEERRLLTQEHCLEAEALLNPDKSVQILFLETCPVGVLGLVASRMVERLGQPILVLTRHPHGALHGSGRAPKGLNLATALESVSDLLFAFGGHAGAAGFQLEESRLSEFMQRLEPHFAQLETAVPTLEIEGVIEPEWLTFEWRAWEQKMEPFGMGNPKPQWCLENVQLSSVKPLGSSGQHARFSFKGGFETVAFFCEDLLEKVEIGTTYDMTITVNENTWNGQSRMQWQLIDLRVC